MSFARNPPWQSGWRLRTAGTQLAHPDERDLELNVLRERLSGLSRLSEASLRINESLDFDEVLQGVLDAARSLTAARHGLMTLLDERGGVRDSLASGLSAAEAERVWSTPEGLRIFQSLTELSEPLRLPDLEAHMHGLGFGDFSTPQPTAPAYRFLAAPMFHRGARVGHVFVGDKEGGGEFSREDEETLVMFASQAALVIANARTHREERRARADLETLVETSPVGVVVFDARSGAPLSVNREALRIVEGLRDEDQAPEETLGTVTCVRPDGRELPLAELLRSGETVRAEEIVLRVPDGRSVSVLLNATPILGGDGEPASFVVTLQDLSPLEEQERLRAEFLGMVSHELRTPLAAVKGSVTTLLEDADELDAAETTQFLRIIRDQSDQMRDLIGDLLDVARIETGALTVAPEPSDLRQLAEDARSRFAGAGGAHAVELELPANLPQVMADRTRAVQVLGNLLSNAARSSPADAPIRVSAAREGVHVAVSVTDEGRGIPAELLPELFRRVPRSSAVGDADGSGLGLAICKGIVEAHGGRIRAESEGPGLGARFTFTLPAVEAAPVPTPASPAAPRASRRSVRVLAVDDDPQDLRYVRDVLAGAGYAPVVTADPGDALRLVAEERPHLALLDLVLPGADGIELMHDILTAADVPVIFLSRYGQDETVARALDMGASDYVVKPFSPAELAARIRAALRKRLEPEPVEPSSTPYVAGDLAIDYARRQATLAGEPLELTATEYAVLYELAVRAPRVLSHGFLIQRIWGPERVGEPWSLRDVVKRLRRKLGDNAHHPTYLFTKRRVGYHLAAPEPQGAEGEEDTDAPDGGA